MTRPCWTTTMLVLHVTGECSGAPSHGLPPALPLQPTLPVRQRDIWLIPIPPSTTPMPRIGGPHTNASIEVKLQVWVLPSAGVTALHCSSELGKMVNVSYDDIGEWLQSPTTPKVQYCICLLNIFYNLYTQ